MMSSDYLAIRQTVLELLKPYFREFHMSSDTGSLVKKDVGHHFELDLFQPATSLQRQRLLTLTIGVSIYDVEEIVETCIETQLNQELPPLTAITGLDYLTSGRERNSNIYLSLDEDQNEVQPFVQKVISWRKRIDHYVEEFHNPAILQTHIHLIRDGIPFDILNNPTGAKANYVSYIVRFLVLTALFAPNDFNTVVAYSMGQTKGLHPLYRDMINKVVSYLHMKYLKI